MIVLRNRITDELQVVTSIAGYSDDWEAVGHDADVPFERLRWDAARGQAVADIAAARAAAWERIKSARAMAMAVATTPFGPFDADAEGKANITGMATSLILLGAEAPTTVTWRLNDNRIATLARADFLAASLMVSAHVGDVYALSWTLQAAIDAAATIAEVDAVTWPS